VSTIKIDGTDGPEEVHLLVEEHQQTMRAPVKIAVKKNRNGLWATLLGFGYFVLTALVWNFVSERIGAVMLFAYGVACVWSSYH